jgi:hypothetical protein
VTGPTGAASTVTGPIGATGPTGPQGSPTFLITLATATPYTLVLADQGRVVYTNSASANVVTIPPTVFPVGAELSIVQYGAGKTQITGGVGVNVYGANGLYLRAQYCAASIIQIISGVWIVTGDTSLT